MTGRGYGLTLAVLAVAVLAAAYLSAHAQGAADLPDNTAPEDGTDSSSTAVDALAAVNQVNPFAMYEKASAAGDAADPQVAAWLATIRHTEGTDRQADPYAVVYGYAFTITDFSDHPAALGWKGGLITRGKYAGKVSTASGAYQFTIGTWQRAKAALGLADFSPESQDAAAVWLTDQRHALDDVKAGDMEAACAKCHAEWASLPGSDAGQGGYSLAEVQDTFTNVGGSLA